jgi:hypothetical protein
MCIFAMYYSDTFNKNRKKMKANIELINSSIELKKNNGIMGYNFYEWILQIKKDIFPDLSLIEIWKQVTIQSI